MLFDLAVIYVACGAPVAVFAYAYPRPRRRKRAVSALVALFAWPLIVIKHSPAADLRGVGSRVGSLVPEIEELFAESDAAERFWEFRETLARYRSLAAARHGNASHRDLLTLAAHPSARIAEACLERKRRRLVESHLSEARHELFALVLLAHDAELVHRTSELAALLGDRSLVEELRSVSDGNAHGPLYAAAA